MRPRVAGSTAGDSKKHESCLSLLQLQCKAKVVAILVLVVLPLVQTASSICFVGFR